MASVKAEKPAAPQSLFGQPKKEQSKAHEGASQSSKPPPKKSEQKPREPKKKAKGGKPASKH
ncbi:unnamed protein product [Victoria cruziana]